MMAAFLCVLAACGVLVYSVPGAAASFNETSKNVNIATMVCVAAAVTGVFLTLFSVICCWLWCRNWIMPCAEKNRQNRETEQGEGITNILAMSPVPRPSASSGVYIDIIGEERPHSPMHRWDPYPTVGLHEELYTDPDARARPREELYTDPDARARPREELYTDPDANARPHEELYTDPDEGAEAAGYEPVCTDPKARGRGIDCALRPLHADSEPLYTGLTNHLYQEASSTDTAEPDRQARAAREKQPGRQIVP